MNIITAKAAGEDMAQNLPANTMIESYPVEIAN